MNAVQPATDVHATRERLRALSELFDTRFEIPLLRWRFGLDAILGLVPAAGDLVGAAAALYGVHLARQAGAPRHLLARMLGNVAIDTLAGSVPVVGDLFDLSFKAHVRNFELFDRWAGSKKS